jgi:cell surface protein SprA
MRIDQHLTPFVEVLQRVGLDISMFALQVVEVSLLIRTALLFQDPFGVSYPYFRDTLTGNFIPFFLVPNITVQESFDPLIEVDLTFTNQVSVRAEFRKTRQLSLSLLDYHT